MAEAGESPLAKRTREIESWKAVADLRIERLEQVSKSMRTAGWFLLSLVITAVGTPFVGWLLKGGIYAIPSP